MKLRTISMALFWACLSLFANAQTAPKREFRGVWMHTIGNAEYRTMTPQRMMTYLTSQLDTLQRAGINAVLFQIRPEADAFYPSQLEPWSRFLTGTQGQAPFPAWDPTAFLIEECHKRNMEFHAWINPYRVQSNINVKLASTHIYYRHPEWFVVYGTQRFFDPGIPESRKFINEVVTDIVTRYDVDAIHMDDYFYPYPIVGKPFPDDQSFQTYGIPNGFEGRRDDWRRNNVNLLIKELHQTIHQIKPWVKFGVSPFGIYRNRKNTIDGIGSETNGLQNYDDLYADILLWLREGWVDYNIPQIYWEIGHPLAEHETLVNWWAAYAYKRPLFIGQDVSRTVSHADLKDNRISQLPRKMYLSRHTPNVEGNCFWSGKVLLSNEGNSLEALTKVYHRYPALVPVFAFMDDKAPKSIKSLKAKWTEDGYILMWKAENTDKEMDKAVAFCVYQFLRGEKINLEDPSKIVAITRETTYKLPYEFGKKKYRYVVTALDRLHNESKAKKKKIKL